MLKMSKNNPNEPRKVTIGKRLYYASLIITCVVLLLATILIKGEDANIVTFYRYMVAFYAFSFIIPTGAIIREFCVEEYNFKKMMIKIIVGIIVIIGASIAFIFVKIASVALALMFLSMAYLLYAITPTIKKSND